MCVGSTTGKTCIYFVHMKTPLNLHEKIPIKTIYFFKKIIDCGEKKEEFRHIAIKSF